MPVKLEIECPFDPQNDTFTLVCRLHMPDGHIWSHEFGPWILSSETRSFGRFEYMEFFLEQLEDADSRFRIGCDPGRAPNVLSRRHKLDILKFIRRIANRYRCRTRGLWWGYGGFVGTQEIHFYRTATKVQQGR